MAFREARSTCCGFVARWPDHSKSSRSPIVRRRSWRTFANAGFTIPSGIGPTVAQRAAPASGHRRQTGIQEPPDRGGHSFQHQIGPFLAPVSHQAL